MSVIAVTMVKDEADVVATTVRHMLTQVDLVLVADNGSTDDTRAILTDLQTIDARLHVVDDPDPAYRQSEKMTALAHQAACMVDEVSWVVPFDADEVWYANGGRIADVLGEITPRLAMVTCDVYDHVATGIDPPTVPVLAMGHRTEAPLDLPKVACRYRHDLVIEQGNHGANYGGIVPMSLPGPLVVRHFPYRSPEQFIRKVRNGYAALVAAGDDLAESSGAHWRAYGQLLEGDGEDALADVFRRYFWADVPESSERPLVYDPAPVN